GASPAGQSARYRTKLAARWRGWHVGAGGNRWRRLQLPCLFHDQPLALGPGRRAQGEPRTQANAAQGRRMSPFKALRRPSGHEDRPDRAVIDIGSNTVRLVVYSGSARAPEVWLNERVVARLGRDLAVTGTIPDKAIDH